MQALFSWWWGLAAVRTPWPEGDEAPAVAPEVTIAEPRLTGGTVRLLAESLAKTRAEVGQCVAQNGGMKQDSGRVDVEFLVRDRGRAEGVELVAARQVSEAAG